MFHSLLYTQSPHKSRGLPNSESAADTHKNAASPALLFHPNSISHLQLKIKKRGRQHRVQVMIFSWYTSVKQDLTSFLKCNSQSTIIWFVNLQLPWSIFPSTCAIQSPHNKHSTSSYNKRASNSCMKILVFSQLWKGLVEKGMKQRK